MATLNSAASGRRSDWINAIALRFPDLASDWLVRLSEAATEVRCDRGEQIYHEGDDADRLYLLAEGEIVLLSPGGEQRVAAGQFLGAESTTRIHHYAGSATVLSPQARLWAIPRDEVIALQLAHPAIAKDIWGDCAVAAQPEADTPSALCWRQLLGWFLCIVLPPLVIAESWRVSGSVTPVAAYLAIFSATVTMWIFGLAEQYVPILFALAMLLLMGVAPPAIVLSGFTSKGFFMALSILALGTLIASSGLSYRLLLQMMRRLPLNSFGYGAGLVLLGLALTPVMPSSSGRVTVVLPFLRDMLALLGINSQSRTTNTLAIATLVGATFFSALFLTSNSLNLVIFGLLPVQEQYTFQWGGWLLATAVAAFVMLAALALGIAVYTRKGEAAVISRDELTQRLQTLGRLTMAEWAALAGLAAFIVGATTASMTGFQLPWIALAILYVLLTLGFLSQREIKERIDWPFLIYLAGTIGLVRSFDALGLGEVVSSGFTWLGALMRHDFPLFVLALFAVVSASRLLLPKEATAVIAATVLMPLGAANGIAPWVIGFLLLLFGATWFFGYQSHIAVRFMEEANHEGTVVSNGAMLRFNLLLAAIRLLAVFCSIPYWKSMGLL